MDYVFEETIAALEWVGCRKTAQINYDPDQDNYYDGIQSKIKILR